jgi:hypothetical protein
LGQGTGPRMVEPGLEDVFPGLRNQPFQIRSSRDGRYNCIAYAAGDRGNWWWPDAAGDDKWPEGALRAETVDAFSDAFGTLGYVVCDDAGVEPGYEKIALFALDGVPKHASRQLQSGRWISKLGMREDIEHSLDDVAGAIYGSVVLVMKRKAVDAND